MIDRVVISHKGDMIGWYYQMVATGPTSTTDHPMAKEEVPLR